MSRLLIFNKPYGVLTQFTSVDGKRTLADYVDVRGVYPAGRLDFDSEGLVVLTDNGRWQAQIADPRHKLAKRYFAQVDGEITDEALQRLAAGVYLGDFATRPCEARRLEPPPVIWPRDPPIRVRKAIPTSWLELTLKEGKNRQVRRMTACVGFPTLRLIRWAVGDWTLDNLAPGKWKEISFPRQPLSKQRVNGRNAPENRGVNSSLPIFKRKETP